MLIYYYLFLSISIKCRFFILFYGGFPAGVCFLYH